MTEEKRLHLPLGTRMSRRSVLRAAGLTTAGMAAASLLAACDADDDEPDVGAATEEDDDEDVEEDVSDDDEVDADDGADVDDDGDDMSVDVSHGVQNTSMRLLALQSSTLKSSCPESFPWITKDR